MSIKLVKVWAPWCGPCKMLAPTIDEVVAETGIEYESVDVDSQNERAGELGVMSVPTILIIKDGEEVERFSGIRPKEAVLDMVNSYK